LRFDQQVYALVRQIPAGRLCAYGDVAAAMGSPRAARQVGFALKRLPLEFADEIPWHRVINAKGMISGRGEIMRPELQHELLLAEGVVFDLSGVCDLNGLRFWDFKTAV
jgi:methylated-DNA-protein-cysteine methyltransferase-like protein